MYVKSSDKSVYGTEHTAYLLLYLRRYVSIIQQLYLRHCSISLVAELSVNWIESNVLTELYCPGTS